MDFILNLTFQDTNGLVKRFSHHTKPHCPLKNKSIRTQEGQIQHEVRFQNLVSRNNLTLHTTRCSEHLSAHFFQLQNCKLRIATCIIIDIYQNSCNFNPSTHKITFYSFLLLLSTVFTMPNCSLLHYYSRLLNKQHFQINVQLNKQT